VNELKKRKREKIISMKREMENKLHDCSNAHNKVNTFMFQVGKCPEDGIESDKAAMENTEGKNVSMDHISVGHQQKLIIKNTFIHVEFEGVLEASRVCDTHDFVVSAGILFTIFDWKQNVIPF